MERGTWIISRTPHVSGGMKERKQPPHVRECKAHLDVGHDAVGDPATPEVGDERDVTLEALPRAGRRRQVRDVGRVQVVVIWPRGVIPTAVREGLEDLFRKSVVDVWYAAKNV